MSIKKKIGLGILFAVLSSILGILIIYLSSLVTMAIVLLSKFINSNSYNTALANNFFTVMASVYILITILFDFLLSKFIFKDKKFLLPLFFLAGFIFMVSLYFLLRGFSSYILTLFGRRTTIYQNVFVTMVFYIINFVVSLIYYGVVTLIRKLRNRNNSIEKTIKTI